MKVLQVIVLLLFLSVLSFAQNKIAVIDAELFEDEKSGITELVLAKKKIAEEFKDSIDKFLIEIDELKKLTNEIEEISKSKFFCTPNLLFEKVDNASKLQKELKVKIDAINLQIEKRKSEIVEPVEKKIIEKLETFKKNKSYLLIIDQISVDGGAIIIDGDITEEFIKFCNEEFEKEKTRKP